MEIKNKLVNTKEYRKSIKLNKKMKRKAKKYENKDMKKCTPLEKYLFSPSIYNDKTIKNNKNKFLKFNKKITLLYAFPKSKMNFLCERFIKMFYENPMDKNIFSTIIDNDFKDKFKIYENLNNFCSYSSIGHIRPQKILEYVEHIKVLFFNFSNNYLGIAFECDLTDKTLTEINNIINSDVEDYIEYREYYIGSKKHIGIYEWNPNILRERKLNNTIIEIKCIINNFLNSYLKFEKKLNNVPISLNIYETNYNITEKTPSIMKTYRMDGYTVKNKLQKFKVGESFSEKSDDCFETNICYDIYKRYNEIDRSSNLYIYTKSDKRNLFISSSSLIELYITTLYEYKLYEFEDILEKERNDIFSIYLEKNNKRIYKSYNIFLNEILKCKTLFFNIVNSNDDYTNDYLKYIMRTQNAHCKKIIEDCEILEKYFEDKLSIENIKETRKVSYISLKIAIISVIIAIVPIFCDNFKEDELIKKLDNINSYLIDTNEDIKEIECETKGINNEIKGIQNYIDVNKNL